MSEYIDEEAEIMHEAVLKNPEAKVHMFYGPDIGGAEHTRYFTVDPECSRLQHEYLRDNPETIHPRVAGYFFQIFERTMPPVAHIRPEGERRVVGALDTLLKLRDRSVPTIWRFPETGLHPKYACNLGDVIIDLAKEK